MKEQVIITLLLIFSTHVTQAQEKLPLIDQSRAIGTTRSSGIKKANFVGFINTPSADLKWKPTLIKITHSTEHELPNQEYIDSMNDVNFKLKNEYRKAHAINNAERTTITTPAIVATFAGNPNDGNTPLDNSVAISNGGYIVSVTNSQIYYYNTSGTPLAYNSIVSFLPPSLSVSGVCDPVVLYDYCADRFIFFCQELNASGHVFSNNRIIICFSVNNNPMNGWYVYALVGDPTGTGGAFDYPKLAVNDSELFITGNIFSEPSGAYNQSVIFQMNKLNGYAGAPSVTYVSYTGILGSPATLLPVSWGQSNCIATGMLLVSTINISGSTIIKVYQINGNNCCSPTITYYTASSPPYYLPSDASQLGTTMPINVRDCRVLSGFYLDTIIHFVFNSSDPTTLDDVINYNRLNITTLTNVSSTFRVAGNDCAYPSVASFATAPTDKSVMIGFGLSSATTYPQIKVVNCDNSMSWSGSTLVKSSSSYVNYGYPTAPPERWGDYTGTSRYHSSVTPSIWMSGMFGDASHHWNTWIAEIGSGLVSTCAMPTGLSPTSVSPTSETLNWSAATGATSYNIQYRQVGTTAWTTTTSATNSITITVTPSTTYEFQVQTVCAAGISSYSSPTVQFTTSAIPPTCSAPTGLSATDVTPNSETLNWNAVSGAISYNVQYRAGTTGAWTVITVTLTSTTITGLSPNTFYQFQVQTVCSSLSSNWASWSFTTQNNLEISGSINTATAKVFPNPISNIFSVEFSLTENVNLNIAVIDINGKTVKELYSGIATIGDNIFSFDKSNLSGGTYFLVIKSNSQTIKNEKIVIAN